jgi:hypothetical protein
MNRIFQDSQGPALVGNPVDPEKSCSSCPFFSILRRLKASWFDLERSVSANPTRSVRNGQVYDPGA